MISRGLPRRGSGDVSRRLLSFHRWGPTSFRGNRLVAGVLCLLLMTVCTACQNGTPVPVGTPTKGATPAWVAETTVLKEDYGLIIPSVPFVADVGEEVVLEIDFTAVPVS